MSQCLIVFNPNSGRGRGSQRAQAVHSALQDAGVRYEAVISQSRGHAIELAERAALNGFSLVVAAGGDGTVNEVINGLMRARSAGTIATLGVIPIGTGNDFASALGIPRQAEAAVARLAARQGRRVDIGCVNGRYFGNNVGIGFEARVNIEAHRITLLRGQLLYLVAALRATASYPFPQVTVQKDGQDFLAKRILMLSVGNNFRAGGGFLLTPEARNDDGLLDMCVVDAIPRSEIFRLLPKAMNGKHQGERAVAMTRFSHLVIKSNDPLPVHADGEILWNDVHRVEITLEPGCLEVMG